jgi:hypothetical protein
MEEFNKLGHETSFFPQFKLINEFSEKDPFPNTTTKLSEDAKEVDVVIFWNWGGSYQYFIDCRRKCPTNVKFVLYNWDPWNPKTHDPRIFIVFDYAFSCCSYDTPRIYFRGNGWYQLLPGFSGKHHYCDFDEKYVCDVSFLTTNLYTDAFPNQYIKRKSIVDALSNSELNFHLYGPEFLGTLYPHVYKGLVDYSINRKVFSSSKINISTHADCTLDEYLNERVITVLGSGGLLLVDKVKGIEKILTNGVNCFFIDRSRGLIGQIREILSLPKEKLEEIRRNGKELADSKWTYAIWCKYIIDRVL